jgi:hypothetical protein
LPFISSHGELTLHEGKRKLLKINSSFFSVCSSQFCPYTCNLFAEKASVEQEKKAGVKGTGAEDSSVCKALPFPLVVGACRGT